MLNNGCSQTRSSSLAAIVSNELVRKQSSKSYFLVILCFRSCIASPAFTCCQNNESFSNYQPKEPCRRTLGTVVAFNMSYLIFTQDRLHFELPVVSYTSKVAVEPNLSTNKNLKEIITTECTKTAIFQLLWPLDVSKLVERELI